MPRDYAQKKRAPRQPAVSGSRVPRWVWMFTSGVVVMFAGGLFFLSQHPGDDAPSSFELPDLSELVPSTPNTPAPEPTTQAEAAPAQDPISRRAQLEFYTLLQQTDVLVPDEILALRQREVIQDNAPSAEERSGAQSSSQASPANASPGQFIIQVASFSNEGDADNLRARLILEGMTQAHVTQADLGERGVFHRVMIGPVTSNRETQSIANRLDNLGLKGLVKAHQPD